jgi:dihydropteroate synthase
MGVLNVTPDSFSDGGQFFRASAAVARAEELAAAGADLIDIGGESTQPGASRVDASQQIRRILPVLEQLQGKLPIVISVDTTLAAVAAAALDAGAYLINDISAGRDDPQMLPLAAQRAKPIILMHMQGQPATMQQAPVYRDVVGEVKDFLAQRLAAAEAAGIPCQRVLLDPGIGFGKTTLHNLALLHALGELKGLGRPLVVGVSRKRFLSQIAGADDAQNRLWGTAASVAWCVTNGAAIVRVHDVEAMRCVARVAWAIANQIDKPPS